MVHGEAHHLRPGSAATLGLEQKVLQAHPHHEGALVAGGLLLPLLFLAGRETGEGLG